MLKLIFKTITLASLVIVPSLVSADSAGRIYGKIYTNDNDTYEGLIRWDKNEVSWVDLLNGTKELPDRNRRESRRDYRRGGGSVSIFGLRIGSSDGNWPDNASSGIRFGHIKTMEVIDDDRVLLILKSGEELELSGGSTDIGEDIRELIIEDEKRGEVELKWDDLERVEFMEARGNVTSKLGERLYGTLTTRRGDEYTGFVCWDVDEALTEDILNGEEKGRSRKIAFGQIASIERYSSSGAVVILENGDEIILKGTNDVDNSNRGIIISDPGFGQVQVEWDEFKSLRFTKAPRAVTYNQFDGGRKLKGTVYTADGDSYTGEIRWDNDEEYTWEMLDGDFRGVVFDIEMGFIKSIEKRSSSTSLVTLFDGRTFRIRGSNDVDSDNKGIFVTKADGDYDEIEWDEFERVEFSK